MAEIKKDGVYRIKGTHNYQQYKAGHVLSDEQVDQLEYVGEFGKPVPESYVKSVKAEAEAENKAAAEPENKKA